MRELHRNDDAFSELLGGEDLAAFLIAQGVEDCNDAACRLMGRPKAELIGRSPLEFCPPTQANGAASATVGRQRVQSALSGLPQWFEWEFSRPDASRVRSLVHLEAIMVAGARRLLLRVRDVSRLERAEQALADTESRLQQILDNASAVVFAKDTEGRYLFANRRFRILFRKREAEIVGGTDSEIFGPEMAERFRANDLKVLESREPLEFEEQAPHRDGVHTYLSVKFPLFDRDGKPYAVCGIATDITDRKRHEEALRGAALAVSGAEGPTVFQELVRYLATILRSDLAFIAVHDSDCPDKLRMQAFYLDGKVAENFDYPRAGTPCETVIGREFRFYPSRLPDLFPRDADFRKLGLQSYAGFPLNDSRGRPLGLISVVSRGHLPDREFTEAIMKIFAARAVAELERQRAEEALRDSEASYRAIFEASEDAIFIHDWDSGAIVDVNPRACARYGYCREEMLRLGVADLSSGIPPYTEEDAARHIASAKQGGPTRFEWHRRNRDGSLHWDEVSLIPAMIAGRRRLLAITREITERKEREEALRRSEERLRATIEAALDCVIGMDRSGKVIEFNAAAERCFGYRRDEALKLSFAELVVPTREGDASEPGGLHYLAAGNGPGRGKRFEVTARRADGMEFPANLAIGVAQSREGDIFIAYLRDATERRQAEQERRRLEAQLRQAQKMEAIGHLTGGIAHDFNNILTSIMGYVVLAAERQAPLGDARTGKYLEQAHLACERARDLIQQMLTFSRGQRGEPRPLSLPPLVKESVKLLRSSLPSTLELRTALQEDVPAVMLDPVQLEQVLLNLCINARDAMGGVGQVRVATRHLPRTDLECTACHQPARGDYVELMVEDSGPGVPAQIRDRIFEPFFSTKEVGKGSGMGLATVHGILHEHGGHVVVETAPGGGARFRVLFPALGPGQGVVTATAEGHVPPDATRPSIAGRVLVVDDEEMVGDFMRDLMEARGLDVTVMRDPAEALEAIRRDPEAFDLLITDQTMPKLTGLELAREIARLGARLPVILYTGYGEGIDNHRLTEAGVCALARKPVDPSALLDLINEQLVASMQP